MMTAIDPYSPDRAIGDMMRRTEHGRPEATDSPADRPEPASGCHPADSTPPAASSGRIPSDEHVKPVGIYRIQPVEQTCHILDAEDRVVFCGSFRDCEEWLDQREQQQILADRRAGNSDSRLARIGSWFGQLLRRCAPFQRADIATVSFTSKSRGRSRN